MPLSITAAAAFAAASIGRAFHSPDTGADSPADVGAAGNVATDFTPTPDTQFVADVMNRAAEKNAKRPAKRPAKKTDGAPKGKGKKNPPADPLALPEYSAPKVETGKGFTPQPRAFEGIEAMIRAQKARKEAGRTQCRPGWSRAVFIDVEEHNGAPALIVRGHDLSVMGANRTKPAEDCEQVWNDANGTPRRIVVATYGKTGAKDANADCDALNNYFGNRFGATSARFAALSTPRAVQLMAMVAAVMGNDPQRTGRYGALSQKAEARAERDAAALARRLERLKTSTNPKVLAILNAHRA